MAIQTFKKMKTQDYLKLFGEQFVHLETDDYIVAVYSNPFDDFRFFSNVNGILLPDGGTHIEYLIRETSNIIKEKLSKKHKTIKYGDVKHKLFVVAIMKNVKDLVFTSQSKTAIMNAESQIRQYLNIDWESFGKQLLKSDFLIEPIVEIFKLKEEAKRRQELKALDQKRPKKIKNEKYTPPTRHYKRLYICEGESAKSGLIAGLGREDFGYFELKGVPMNTHNSPIQKVIKNVELVGLAEVLGLKWSGELQTCTFEEIIISTDQDLDGQHIRGLLLGFVEKYAPNYFKENRVKIFVSPYMLIKNKDKIEDVIFDMNDDKVNVKGKTVKILKGLGSWSADEFDQMISKFGLEYFIHDVDYDTEAQKFIADWLGDNVDARKEYIKNLDFNINLA